MHHKVKSVVVSLVICLLFTGCWDRIEPNEQSYVYVIGIENGIKDKLRLTLQYATFQAGGGSGGGGSGGSGDTSSKGQTKAEGTVISSVECPSFFTGINMLQLSSDATFNLMHTKMLVISEDLARKGIGKYAAPLIRYREIRRSMKVIIVKKSSASEFIKLINPVVGKNPGKAIDLILSRQSQTGYNSPVTFRDFYNTLKSSYDQPIASLAAINDFTEYNMAQKNSSSKKEVTGGKYLPGEVPRSGGLNIDIYGTAVFDEDKMSGELNGDETRMILMCRGEFIRGFFTIEDPSSEEFIIALDIKPSRAPVINVSFEDGKPVIFCKISLEGDIQSIQSMIQYEKPEMIHIIEEKLISTYKPILDETIRKCLENYKSDVMGFGRHAAIYFPTVQEWEKYDWLHKVINAKVTTEIDFKIRRTGIISTSMPITPHKN